MIHIFIPLLALLSGSIGADITLSTVAQFTIFIKNVNSKTNYSGTTVYLGSDITLPESIDFIGKNETHQFRGVFDGQGYIISGLKISSSSAYLGLFGYSNGLTIKNVVLDSSCSITSTISGPNHANVGGIIGRCDAVYGQCNIENCVNMADVTFSGSITNYLFIGGVIGYFSSSSNYDAYLKNCVNYGSVTDSGKVSSRAELGGIVGISNNEEKSLYNTGIQNCLNYGAITHSGTTASYLMIGGIVGNGAYTTCIENCVSSGKISTHTTASSNNHIGSIVGQIVSDIHINYCYYTSDVNASSIYGHAYFAPSTTGTFNSTTTVNSDLVSKLNSNATSCNWNKWLMLHLNGGGINNLPQEPLIGIQGRIPNPVKEGNSFLFWCKDAECTDKFDPNTGSVSEITDLYAAWTPNNYTVTLDVSGGNELSDSEATKTVTFNKAYGELPEPKRAGYMFLGWFTNENDGVEVTNETIVTMPYNHTLYAHWEEITTKVEIVFNIKDLTEEEAKNIIKQYTNANFTIAEFRDESGEMRAIIKFSDKEEAKNFVKDIKESNEARNIKKISFIPDDSNSISTTIYPHTFFNVLFL